MPLDPQEVQQLFLKAIELPHEARAEFLIRQCADNEPLRQRIEELLLAHDREKASDSDRERRTDETMDSEAFVVREPDVTHDSEPILAATFDSQPDEAANTRTITPRGIEPGVVIDDRYVLLEKIGEGGMGEVWVARQTKPVKRKVAIKLIKAGMDSQSVLARFEQERQALAIMDHPNIAGVLDGGLTPAGQPFFVMELVNGLSVTRFCDEAKLSPRERLELFVPICHAVQHAHQKGVVHRDLKPANILVTMVDGHPVPKVIDFGVAKATHGKLTEQTLSTQFGAVVGTLEYMSPEQAGFSGVDIDTRSDIYSLGIILYELLTGLRPIDSARLKQAALAEMVRIIQEEEPSKPSTRLATDASLPSLAAMRQTDPRKLMALLRGELDWVVLKCLEKSRDRRYETANGLARDIQRYLKDEPVEARPPTAGYRLQKFLSRNRGLVAAAAIISVSLVAGVIGTSLGMMEANRQKLVAEDEAEAANIARMAEQQQRELAEKANRQALTALDSFTSNLMKRLLGGKSEITETEKAILQDALAQWETFAQSKGNSAEAQEMRALGSANVSEIQFELGMTELALASDRRTLEIWSGLLKDYPENENYRKRVANGCQDLGATLRSIGRRKESAGYFARAVDERASLAADYPGQLDYQSSQGESLISMGNVERDFGNWDASRRHYLAALAIHEKLAQLEPDADLHRENVAWCHWGMAFLCKRQDLFDESKGHYQNAIQTLRVLAEKNKNQRSYIENVGRLYREVGVMLADSGDPKSGAAELKNALPIQKKLFEEFPSVPNYANEYSKSLRDLAKALREDNRFEESETYIGEAVEIQEKLVQAHPTVISYQSSLGFTLRIMGRLYEKLDRPLVALKTYGRSISVLTSAYAQDRNYQNVQNALWQSHKYRAVLLDELGRHQEALLDWEKTLEHCHEEDKYMFQCGQADSLLRSGEVATAIEKVEQLSEIENSNPGHYFRFAKLYAIASERLPDRSEELAAKSVTLLQQAVELGLDDPQRIMTDKELEILNARDDFQAVLQSLNEKD